MADDLTLTLPGDIPGLLRRGSPVLVPRGMRGALAPGVLVGESSGRTVAFDDGCGFRVDANVAIRLDLTGATGRAHAAWWLDANAVIPLDRLVGGQLDYATARGLPGLDWCEACWVVGIGTRGEILDAVRLARTGLPMTADQIDRLRRVVLHTAGRSL